MATATDSITRRFAAACGLPGQYAGTAAPTPASSAAFVQPGTVVQEGSGANNCNAQQLTIFYGGMVVVLDCCTPEKVAELIRLAAAAAGQGAPQPTPTLVDIPISRKESLRRFLSKRKDRAAASNSKPVPYGRKDEQPEPEPAAKKGKLLEVSREEAASWLALGSLGSMHAR